VTVTLVDAWRAPAARDFFRNVWPMYVHEISGFDSDFYSLDETGRWRPDIVEDWIAGATPAANLRTPVPDADPAQPLQRTHVVATDGRPVGFVCVGVRPFKYMPDDVDLCVAELFLVHACRGTDVARAAVEQLLARYAGRWHLRAIHDNVRAIRFWKRTLPGAGVRDLEERREGADVTFRFVTGPPLA
jgi:predicted acetyltransferase